MPCLLLLLTLLLLLLLLLGKLPLLLLLGKLLLLLQCQVTHLSHHALPLLGGHPTRASPLLLVGVLKSGLLLELNLRGDLGLLLHASWPHHHPLLLHQGPPCQTLALGPYHACSWVGHALHLGLGVLVVRRDHASTLGRLLPLEGLGLGHLTLGLCHTLDLQRYLHCCLRRPLLLLPLGHGALTRVGLLLWRGGWAQTGFTQGLVEGRGSWRSGGVGGQTSWVLHLLDIWRLALLLLLELLLDHLLLLRRVHHSPSPLLLHLLLELVLHVVLLGHAALLLPWGALAHPLLGHVPLGGGLRRGGLRAHRHGGAGPGGAVVSRRW